MAKVKVPPSATAKALRSHEKGSPGSSATTDNERAEAGHEGSDGSGVVRLSLEELQAWLRSRRRREEADARKVWQQHAQQQRRRLQGHVMLTRLVDRKIRQVTE